MLGIPYYSALTKKAALELMYKLLNETYHYTEKAFYRTLFYEEAKILSYINIFVDEEAYDSRYKGLLKKVLDDYEVSEIDKVYCCRSWSILSQHYIIALYKFFDGNSQTYKDMAQFIQNDNEFCIYCGHAGGMASNLLILAGVALSQGCEKAGKHYAEQAFWMSNLYSVEEDEVKIATWYKEKYGIEIPKHYEIHCQQQ